MISDWRQMFRRRRQPPPRSGLHQCPLCHGDFVVAVEVEALDEGRWGSSRA